MSYLSDRLATLAVEPPFRLLARAVLKRLPVSVPTRARWDISPRPQYLIGLLEAATEAKRRGVPEFAAIEFGVAGGNGLIVMEREAATVEAHTGVKIRVYGFDNGSAGLPEFIGDYRDHPDAWQPGDFPMDEAALKARLGPRTTLILGNIRDTVPQFVDDPGHPPVGFLSVDVDLYSSAVQALSVLSLPNRRMLLRVPIYFDDVTSYINHRFAGELLAIDEFNRGNERVKIDVWRGVRWNRPFPEKTYLEKMYMAHDLEAIDRTAAGRDRVALPLTRR